MYPSCFNAYNGSTDACVELHQKPSNERIVWTLDHTYNLYSYISFDMTCLGSVAYMRRFAFTIV
jgi:hypothetical protein